MLCERIKKKSDPPDLDYAADEYPSRGDARGLSQAAKNVLRQRLGLIFAQRRRGG